MRLIDAITVKSGSARRRIELLQGDLTKIPSEHAVDLLVLSAFPNDYVPTTTSLIGALAQKGLSVQELAEAKHIDMRSTCSCWLSQELHPSNAGLRFKRILCFEPAVRGRPPELVGDIFRALTPFVGGEPAIRSFAMPILAVGDQGYPISEVLPPLIEAAVQWLTIGLPVDTIKIVSYGDRSSAEATAVFAAEKIRHTSTAAVSGARREYDVFVSYCRKDLSAGTSINAALRKRDLKVFFDEQSLDRGVAWQQKIFDALDSCTRMVALYSPAYIQSKVCQEEFNIAWSRARNESETVIFPIYWASTNLPTYMSMLNFVDCREQSEARLGGACDELALAVAAKSVRPDHKGSAPSI